MMQLRKLYVKSYLNICYDSLINSWVLACSEVNYWLFHFAHDHTQISYFFKAAFEKPFKFIQLSMSQTSGSQLVGCDPFEIECYFHRGVISDACITIHNSTKFAVMK